MEAEASSIPQASSATPDLNQNVRLKRFAFPERANIKVLDNRHNHSQDYWSVWWEKNKNLTLEHEKTYREIVQLAAQGILKEGQILNKDSEAQEMAVKLRAVSSWNEAKETAVSLYTAESFLYHLVNLTLRNKDMSKLDTLGPFCYLLRYYQRQKRGWDGKVVYRGMDLTDEMIEEYKKAIGRMIVWYAFSSTSKDRQLAESFGNTLFIITTDYRSLNYQHDVSTLSQFANEQEVLLEPQYAVIVNRVEYDATSKKHLIYVTSEFNESW